MTPNAIYDRFIVPDSPENELWALKRDLAAQFRQLMQLCVTSEGDVQNFAKLKALLQDQIETFGFRDGKNPYKSGYGDGSFYESPEWFEDRNPVVGLSNPLSPPLKILRHAEHITATVRYSALYEGPPGNVHGGYVAAAMDQALGHAAINARIPCMTGTLSVRYKAPTPIEQDLTVFAKLENTEGKKLIVRGQMKHGEKVTAEAEGIFINLTGKNFVEHLKQPSAA